MKALVTYYSDTGNTEKLAHAIYEEIHFEKEIRPLSDVQSADGYDIIFCGFPVQAQSLPRKAQDFIKSLPAGQKVAFFSTHGSLRGGHLPRQAFEHALGLAAKSAVLGHFGCRGEVRQNIIDALLKKPEHRAWAEEAMGAAGHPDAQDLADGKTFAKEILARLSR